LILKKYNYLKCNALAGNYFNMGGMIRMVIKLKFDNNLIAVVATVFC